VLGHRQKQSKRRKRRRRVKIERCDGSGTGRGRQGKGRRKSYGERKGVEKIMRSIQWDKEEEKKNRRNN
jgi:hypothetical protein